MQNNTLSGFGNFCSSSKLYVGEFEKNSRSGFGKLTDKLGFYDGFFGSNKKCGFGAFKTTEGHIEEKGIYKNNQLYIGKREELNNAENKLSPENATKIEVEGCFEGFGIVKMAGRRIECCLKEFKGVKDWKTVGRILIEGKDEFLEGSIFEGKLEGVGRHFKEGKLLYEGEFKGI